MRKPLRTKVLRGFHDRLYLWRSETTGTLYRWSGRWQMFYVGRWRPCYTDSGYKPFDLHGVDGETFIRVGAIRPPLTGGDT